MTADAARAMKDRADQVKRWLAFEINTLFAQMKAEGVPEIEAAVALEIGMTDVLAMVMAHRVDPAKDGEAVADFATLLSAYLGAQRARMDAGLDVLQLGVPQ